MCNFLAIIYNRDKKKSFQQDFDLESYLRYEQEKLDQKRNQLQFDRLEKYDYDHDEDYTTGLPNIIRGWVQDQTVNGLWDKEKLQLEFSKAKAFYYVAYVFYFIYFGVFVYSTSFL